MRPIKCHDLLSYLDIPPIIAATLEQRAKMTIRRQLSPDKPWYAQMLFWDRFAGPFLAYAAILAAARGEWGVFAWWTVLAIANYFFHWRKRRPPTPPLAPRGANARRPAPHLPRESIQPNKRAAPVKRANLVAIPAQARAGKSAKLLKAYDDQFGNGKRHAGADEYY